MANKKVVLSLVAIDSKGRKYNTVAIVPKKVYKVIFKLMMKQHMQ